MTLPINIEDLLGGLVVEGNRVEYKKVGIPTPYIDPSALSPMISTILAEVTSSWVLKKKTDVLFALS